MSKELTQFKTKLEGLDYIQQHLPEIIFFGLDEEFVETDPHRKRKNRIQTLWQSVLRLDLEIPDQSSLLLPDLLIDLIEELQVVDLVAAHRVSNLLVRWDINSARMWYEKAKLMFQLFTTRELHDIDEIVGIFQKVIELGKQSEEDHELPYWGYVFIGNIYLYRILTGEEALEQALKFYNQGYRYAKTENIEVNDELIFQNVETMQQILMNQYPLLVIIYNNFGSLLFDFLFQFIEVMNHDQRFIPNFTALLSAVDDHINDLFKSPVSSSYIVMKNRLLVIATIKEENNDSWVKTAMVFSYLQQAKFEVNKDMVLLEKVSDFNERLNQESDIMSYLTNFDGRKDPDMENTIQDILNEVFSAITD